MVIYFITGNSNKFQEVKTILPEIEQMDVDLPEIQDIDAKVVIRAKLIEALNHRNAELVVEDTSLYFECLNGLPGPLIKWFMKTIGNEGLFDIASRYGNFNAEARTIVGYARTSEEIYFFDGSVKGTVVSPQGVSGFGWDPIFQPYGHLRSLAQMSKDEKNQISSRRIAFDRLSEFLRL